MLSSNAAPGSRDIAVLRLCVKDEALQSTLISYCVYCLRLNRDGTPGEWIHNCPRYRSFDSLRSLRISPEDSRSAPLRSRLHNGSKTGAGGQTGACFAATQTKLQSERIAELDEKLASGQIAEVDARRAAETERVAGIERQVFIAIGIANVDRRAGMNEIGKKQVVV